MCMSHIGWPELIPWMPSWHWQNRSGPVLGWGAQGPVSQAPREWVAYLTSQNRLQLTCSQFNQNYGTMVKNSTKVHGAFFGLADLTMVTAGFQAGEVYDLNVKRLQCQDSAVDPLRFASHSFARLTDGQGGVETYCTSSFESQVPRGSKESEKIWTREFLLVRTCSDIWKSNRWLWRLSSLWAIGKEEPIRPCCHPTSSRDLRPGRGNVRWAVGHLESESEILATWAGASVKPPAWQLEDSAACFCILDCCSGKPCHFRCVFFPRLNICHIWQSELMLIGVLRSFPALLGSKCNCKLDYRTWSEMTNATSNPFVLGIFVCSFQCFPKI